jgi:hypothetical protein
MKSKNTRNDSAQTQQPTPRHKPCELSDTGNPLKIPKPGASNTSPSSPVTSGIDLPASPTLPHDPLSGPSTHPNHRRNGKVARLPSVQRDLVNLMLRDGKSYPAIIKKLAENGFNLNADNLSRWYSGGYQEWLQEQAWLQEAQDRANFASEVVSQPSGDLITEVSLRIALIRMYTLLLDFQPAVLKDTIATNPGMYPRLLNVLCKLTQGAMKLEQYRREKANPMAAFKT